MFMTRPAPTRAGAGSAPTRPHRSSAATRSTAAAMRPPAPRSSAMRRDVLAQELLAVVPDVRTIRRDGAFPTTRAPPCRAAPSPATASRARRSGRCASRCAGRPPASPNISATPMYCSNTSMRSPRQVRRAEALAVDVLVELLGVGREAIDATNSPRNASIGMIELPADLQRLEPHVVPAPGIADQRRRQALVELGRHRAARSARRGASPAARGSSGAGPCRRRCTGRGSCRRDSCGVVARRSAGCRWRSSLSTSIWRAISASPSTIGPMILRQAAHRVAILDRDRRRGGPRAGRRARRGSCASRRAASSISLAAQHLSADAACGVDERMERLVGAASACISSACVPSAIAASVRARGRVGGDAGHHRRAVHHREPFLRSSGMRGRPRRSSAVSAADRSRRGSRPCSARRRRTSRPAM